MIDLIWTWFKKAVPSPTDKNKAVQYGVHLEEVAEGLAATGDVGMSLAVGGISSVYKFESDNLNNVVDHKEFLDALCDQIVTAVGTAYMMGYDIRGALEEVNRSNWSKFVDGVPVFDENGKIKKGPNYSPPDLSKFV